MNWSTRFSDAASRVADADAVIGILKLAEQPGIISLAGGLPDPRVFRMEETQEAMARVLTDHGPEALNYSPNPGITELREFLATRMARIERIRCTPEEILVCSGGLEGIRHAFNALTNPGDPVLVEDPTYMVALQVCRELAGMPVGVASDDAGMIPEALDDTVRRLAREGRPPGSSTWDRASRTRRAAPGASGGAARCWRSRSATTWRSSRTTPTANSATRGSGCRRSSRSRPSG